MPAAGVVMIVAVVLIVLALVYYLVSTIVALRQITAGLDEAIAGVGGIIEKSAPVAEVVQDINRNLDAGVDLLEGLLVKKAGLEDAMGLVEGLYAGAASEGLRNFPDSQTLTPPRISDVYTKGTLTLARLGREAPIAAASPNGPVLRNVGGRAASTRRSCSYPETRQTRPEKSGEVAGDRGTDAPVQYEPSPERPGGRRGVRVTGASCRPAHSSTNGPPASRARSRRSSGAAPRRGSSPAGIACCR